MQESYNSQEHIDTKIKILNAAKKLFSERGFHGTSTREIAAFAGVNLAGLHYHFQTKNHLYEEVVKNIYFEICGITRQCLEKMSCSTEKLAESLLQLMFDMGANFVQKFRIIAMMPPEMLETLQIDDKVHFGPGGQVLYESLNKEFGDKISSSLKEWAARVIVSYIHQSALRYHISVDTRLAVDKDIIIEDGKKLFKVVMAELCKEKGS